jgi:hypothetical protein
MGDSPDQSKKSNDVTNPVTFKIFVLIQNNFCCNFFSKINVFYKNRTVHEDTFCPIQIFNKFYHEKEQFFIISTKVFESLQSKNFFLIFFKADQQISGHHWKLVRPHTHTHTHRSH